MKTINELLLIISFASSTPISAILRSPGHAKSYRKDYTYNQDDDSFYKYHSEGRSYRGAKAKCEEEGADIMNPISKTDILYFYQIFRSSNVDLLRIDSIKNQRESLSKSYKMDFNVSIEKTRLDEIKAPCYALTKIGDTETVSCFYKIPFICKVNATEAPYNVQCDVYGAEYIYCAKVNSCYKVTRSVMTWDEGLAECDVEGAHLVVINSMEEYIELNKIIKKTLRVGSNSVYWFYFIGVRAAEPSRVFKTIFNETLEEAGFNLWAENEPNNYRNSEYCGSIIKTTGKLNDINCAQEYAVVCEKEVHS